MTRSFILVFVLSFLSSPLVAGPDIDTSLPPRQIERSVRVWLHELRSGTKISDPLTAAPLVKSLEIIVSSPSFSGESYNSVRFFSASLLARLRGLGVPLSLAYFEVSRLLEQTFRSGVPEAGDEPGWINALAGGFSGISERSFALIELLLEIGEGRWERNGSRRVVSYAQRLTALEALEPAFKLDRPSGDREDSYTRRYFGALSNIALAELNLEAEARGVEGSRRQILSLIDQGLLRLGPNASIHQIDFAVAGPFLVSLQPEDLSRAERLLDRGAAFVVNSALLRSDPMVVAAYAHRAHKLRLMPCFEHALRVAEQQRLNQTGQVAAEASASTAEN